MPLATLAAQITATGILAPSYAEILTSLQESFQIIYGTDAYIAPDSQDGQMLAIVAKAIDDCNQTAIATFNSFSPTYAQGAGLSSVVKLNGIRRLSASYSSSVGNVIGQAGTEITNGSVKDDNGKVWDLPPLVTIPPGGSISVTVTAHDPGAIVAPAGTINTINSPTFGWQSFVSTVDAVAGAPVETDAELRQRQTISTSLSAETVMDSLLGNLSNLPGVDRVKVYENQTGAPDVNGLPGHSIAAVVSGGTVSDIVTVIGKKKTPGADTYGTTTGVYTDPISGIPYNIHYFPLSEVTIKVAIVGTALAGYSSPTGTDIKNAIATYLNSLDIGQDVQISRLYTPAYLNRALAGLTYEITSLTIAKGAGPFGTSDIAVAFNEAAISDALLDITVSIT